MGRLGWIDMRKVVLALLACGGAWLQTDNVAADPIDNPDTADFIWYNNPGSPFLEFGSGEDIFSYASGGPSSKFRADVDSLGDMDFISSSTQYYPTSINILGVVNVKLVISNVVGTTDCSNSTNGSQCEIDWDVTASLWFDGGIVSEASCQTSSFSILVTGEWDNTISAGFTIPDLTGSGSQTCSGLASFMSNYWDFDGGSATLSLYKYETDTFGGGPLVGSP